MRREEKNNQAPNTYPPTYYPSPSGVPHGHAPSHHDPSRIPPTAGSPNNMDVVAGYPPTVVLKENNLPCGCGMGWVMFVLGWFFLLPWYIGACMLICSKHDRRERPGHIASAIMAVISTILIIIAAVKISQEQTY